MQFRHEARQALARAKALLAQGDDHALRYAALELRLTLEAGVYDRLHDYRRDVPPSVYEVWPPPKVLRLLLEVDPDADQPSTVRITRRGGGGDTPASVTFSETPIDRFMLKGNYDALGSYLHMPTLKQITKDGGPDFAKLRKRCEALVALLDPMVTPLKQTFIGGRFSHCGCTRCGADMRKRVPPGVTGELAAVCQGCEAPYRLFVGDDDPDRWSAVKYGAPCHHEGCAGEHGIFPDELKQGHRWTCDQCGGDNAIDLVILAVSDPAKGDDGAGDR
ncbi:hypothetical protein [Caulobacter sp. 602-1]|uniref:hypothetical protein n=1 Tax=Caulobacter sp. 602-1 TaxID=2492472 RepID=UPI000F631E08|nr:hypothetical protein [Caulobacter sp. 602-1]RRN64699.1 hypothetical protein EIK80_11735 [Caulobacter sp. 602-1]